MKFLIVASMLVGGGSTVALNEDVQDACVDAYKEFRGSIRQNFVSNIQENGFPYPNEEYLSSLTEEQRVAVISQVDVINATYDFTSMTNEELRTALDDIRTELHLFYDELGIEPPMVQAREQFREEFQNRHRNRHGHQRGGKGGSDPIYEQEPSEQNTDQDTL